MIQTFSEAKLLLQHLNIPVVLQQKILTLFLSYGTPSANMIKTECLKINSISHYDDNIKTLWRLKLYNSNYSLYNINHSIIKEYYSRLNISHCDLSAASVYPYPQSNMVNNQFKNYGISLYLIII